MARKPPEIRRKILEGLEKLGISLDADRNSRLTGEGLITAADSPVPVFVIPTDEERAIAADTYLITTEIEGGHEY